MSPRVYFFFLFLLPPSLSRCCLCRPAFLRSSPDATIYLFYSLPFNDTEPMSIFPPNKRTKYHFSSKYHATGLHITLKLIGLSYDSTPYCQCSLLPSLHSELFLFCERSFAYAIHTIPSFLQPILLTFKKFIGFGPPGWLSWSRGCEFWVPILGVEST